MLYTGLLDNVSYHKLAGKIKFYSESSWKHDVHQYKIATCSMYISCVESHC